MPLPKINLPTDPKKRQEIILGSVIGGVILLVVLVWFVVVPQFKARTERRAAIAVLEQENAKAIADTQNLKNDRQTNYEVLYEIFERNVKPRFLIDEVDSFIIPAERIVRQLATEVGIELAAGTILDAGANDFMVVSGVNIVNDKTVICRSHSVQVSLQCSYYKLIELLGHIQKANPGIAISSLTITDIPSDIRQHQVNFTIQWPAWRTSDQAQKLTTAFKAAEASALTRIGADAASANEPLAAPNSAKSTAGTGGTP